MKLEKMDYGLVLRLGYWLSSVINGGNIIDNTFELAYERVKQEHRDLNGR